MENYDKMQSNWYVLQVMSGQENRAFQQIMNRREQDAREGIDDGVDDIRIPIDLVETTRVNKKGEKKVVPVPRKRYPGYVLIQVRLYQADGRINADVWDLVKNTQGVIGFVGGEHPVKLSKADVAEMLRKEVEEEAAPKTKVLFHVGENVIVKAGAFEGFNAVIGAIDNEHARLTLTVNFLGRSTPIELGNDEVEKVQA